MRMGFTQTPEQNDNRRGFTIVELLIVVVVIAILAAITIVSYNGIQNSARSSALTAELAQVAKKLELAKIADSSGAYPLTLADANVVAPSNTTLTYSSSASYPAAPATYCLTATSDGRTSHIATAGSVVDGPCPGHPGVQVANLRCASGYITAPGNSLFGTKAFCVMKYEAKDVGGVATSQASGTPWVSISQPSAISISAAACTGCHLITDAEWMTIADNVLAVPSNWSGGAVGSGYVYGGHSDTVPANFLAAATSDSDSDGYGGTGQTSGNQHRTLTLTNGEVLWDLSGNVHEWTMGTIVGGQQPGLSGETAYALKQYNNPGLIQSGFPANGMPGFGTAVASGWSSSQGIVQIYSNFGDSSAHAHKRGGSWGGGTSAGVFSLNLFGAPSDTGLSLGFRVAR
jgi:prepilin-type N-terminal cleavage/methylation domain-containing protein